MAVSQLLRLETESRRTCLAQLLHKFWWIAHPAVWKKGLASVAHKKPLRGPSSAWVYSQAWGRPVCTGTMITCALWQRGFTSVEWSCLLCTCEIPKENQTCRINCSLWASLTAPKVILYLKCWCSGAVIIWTVPKSVFMGFQKQLWTFLFKISFLNFHLSL